MRHFVWLASSIAARVALVGAVGACIVGQWVTIVLMGPQDVLFCISSHGLTFSANPQTFTWRIPKLAPWQMSSNLPHPDDSGLFFGSLNQQFVPAFYLPGAYVVKGGWGVSEWGDVGFIMASRSSFAVVVRHAFLISPLVALNVIFFLVFRKMPKAPSVGERSAP